MDRTSRTFLYMAFKGDYTWTSTQCQDTVNAIKAVGGKAEYIQLDEAGWWQGSYSRWLFGNDYVGPFAGVSHMMMIEDNPAPGRDGKPTNLQVMDVILEWSKRNIKTRRRSTATTGVTMMVMITCVMGRSRRWPPLTSRETTTSSDLIRP